MDKDMGINYEEEFRWVFTLYFITVVYFKMHSLRQKVQEKYALATRSIEDLIKPFLGVSLVYMLTTYMLQESNITLNLNFINNIGVMSVSYLCVGDFKQYRPLYAMLAIVLPAIKSEEHAMYLAYFNALSMLVIANLETRLSVLLHQLKSSKAVTKKQKLFCQHADRLSEQARIKIALAYAVASMPLALYHEWLEKPAKVANLGIYLLLVNSKCKVLDVAVSSPEFIEYFAVLRAYCPLTNHKIKDKVCATAELMS